MIQRLLRNQPFRTLIAVFVLPISAILSACATHPVKEGADVYAGSPYDIVYRLSQGIDDFAELRRVIAIARSDPTNARIHAYIAAKATESALHGLAIFALSEARKQNPGSPVFVYNLGVLMAVIDELDAARGLLEFVSIQDSDRFVASRAVGLLVRMDMGREVTLDDYDTSF